MTVGELMSLSGRRALVRGAAGGIGRVIAQTLVELLLLDRPDASYRALTQ